jgi:GNAT superfamily N-acetyltransferase
MKTIDSLTELADLRPLFDGLPTAFFLESMLAGNCAWQAWADDLRPGSALVWDRRDLFFAVGSPANASFNNGLSALFGESLLPAARARNQASFLIHPSSPGWDPLMAGLLPGFTLNRYPRVIYEAVELPAPGWKSEIPAGFRLRSIDHALLAETGLEGHSGLVEEIESCWPSLAHFYEQGFGAALLEGSRIACRITAEYVYPGHVGIGILTEDVYRGKGLAPLATAAFLEMCAERGLAPHWDAWLNNRPSLRAAEKAGFSHPVEYSALLAYLPAP